MLFTVERCEYLVKWVNWDEADATWEPERNLKYCRDLIDDFEEGSDRKVIHNDSYHSLNAESSWSRADFSMSEQQKGNDSRQRKKSQISS